MADFITFAAAVSRMRTAQKDYFRKRTQTFLTQAKAAEQEVDRMLIEIAPQHVAVRADLAAQGNLFNQDMTQR